MRRRFFSKRFDYMILYTSTDENIVTPKSFAGFNQNIKSNTYNHIGKITFRGPFSIGRDVFHDCDNLKTIIIPNSVTSIGEYAFYNCSSLTSIEIGNSVTSIGYEAFSWCESLICIVVDSGNTKYDSRNGCNAIIETASNTLIAGCQNTIIPNSVTSIGENAFYYCNSLTSIEIPNSVTSIGAWVFYNCTSLKSVYIKSTTPPTLGAVVFDYNASGRKIYVPRASLNAYKTASGWKDYASAIMPYDY